MEVRISLSYINWR